MSWPQARARFPVLERFAYLNAGTFGPLARATLDAESALRSWEGAPGAGALAMAVNVSPSQLTHLGFARDFDQVLGESGVHPSRLLLEVTELGLI